MEKERPNLTFNITNGNNNEVGNVKMLADSELNQELNVEIERLRGLLIWAISQIKIKDLIINALTENG